MWELDCEESWALKNWFFWTVVLEKTLESPSDSKEIQPIHPKGNQSWIFIGRTDAEAETPILWLSDVKNWLLGKDPTAGKDWRWEEKEMTEDDMVGWHHRLDGHEFDQALGVGDGQGGLVCCSSWGLQESDMTEQLNWTDYSIMESIVLICNNAFFQPLWILKMFWWLKRGPYIGEVWEYLTNSSFYRSIWSDIDRIYGWGKFLSLNLGD